MAQRPDKSHVLIVLDSANSMQPRAPHGFAQGTTDTLPVDARHTRPLPASPGSRCPDQTSDASPTRGHHGPPTLPATDRFSPMPDRPEYSRTAGGRQLRYDLFSNMNRHADDHHSGIGDNVPGARPVLLFQNTDLIARQREHFSNRRPICPPPPPTMTTGRREGQSVLNPYHFRWSKIHALPGAGHLQ